jgi:hypothetical protein
MFTSDWPLVCSAKNLLCRERARVRHLKEVIVAAEKNYIRGQQASATAACVTEFRIPR